MLMIHGDSDAVFLSGRHVRGSRDRLLGQARRVPIVIALVVYNLRPLPRDEEPETLEMLRMAFKPETRRELQEAAQRSGVKVLLSDPDGPALRGLGLWP